MAQLVSTWKVHARLVPCDCFGQQSQSYNPKIDAACKIAGGGADRISVQADVSLIINPQFTFSVDNLHTAEKGCDAFDVWHSCWQAEPAHDTSAFYSTAGQELYEDEIMQPAERGFSEIMRKLQKREWSLGCFRWRFLISQIFADNHLVQVSE